MGQISIEVTFEVFCDDYLVKWGVKSYWVVSFCIIDISSKKSIKKQYFKFGLFFGFLEEQYKTDGNSLTQ